MYFPGFSVLAACFSLPMLSCRSIGQCRIQFIAQSPPEMRRVWDVYLRVLSSVSVIYQLTNSLTFAFVRLTYSHIIFNFHSIAFILWIILYSVQVMQILSFICYKASIDLSICCCGNSYLGLYFE